ncbi:MAG: leucine-rich repeat protein [Clostridia bacterium]
MYSSTKSKSLIIIFPTIILIVILSGIIWYLNSISLVSVYMVSEPTKTEYVVGESFDDEGIELEAFFSFGMVKTVKNYFDNIPDTFSTAGNFTYLILYSERGVTKSTELHISVESKVLTNFTIENPPTKTEYLIGQTLNRSGMLLKATYNNRIVETININDPCIEIENGNFNSVASQLTVNVSYSKFGVTKTQSFNVSVQDKELTSIFVSENPYKTSYIQTESFNPEGLVLQANYNNGESYQLDIFSNNFEEIKQEVGMNKALTFSFFDGTKTLSTTINVDIVAKTVTNLTLIEPNKTTYFANENFDSTGMQIVASYNDLTSETISAESCITDFATVVSKAGLNKQVSFEFQGVSKQFSIDVLNEPMDEDDLDFQDGMITGLKSSALTKNVITIPASINGVNVISARIPKQANSNIDDGSLILDLSYATYLKTLLIEQLLPVGLVFDLPASLSNIIVFSSDYLALQVFPSSLIRLATSYFTFNNGTLSLIKATNPKISDMVIPAFWIDGTIVEKVGDFQNVPSLNTVCISEGITEINDNAFNNSLNISLISLPESLTKIGASSFQNNYKLSKFYIGKNVSSIQASAFNRDTNLREFIVDSENTAYSVTSGFLVTKDKKKLVRFAEKSPFGYNIPSEIEIIGTFSFGFSKVFTEMVISASIKEIESNAFAQSTLESIEFSAGSVLTTIGTSPFSGTPIREAVFPSSVVSISMGLFYQCQYLQSAIFNTSSLTEIPIETFWGCSSLQSFIVPENVTDIKSSAFYGCLSLSNLIMPNTLQRIETNAFANCKSLGIIDLKGVLSIHSTAFIGCTGLQQIQTNEFSTYQSVDGVLFKDNLQTLFMYPLGKPATSYTVPDGVTLISEKVFSSSDILEEIITNDVVVIQDAAFENCNKLYSVIMDRDMGGGIVKSVLTTINSRAFAYCSSLKNLNIGKNVSDIKLDFTLGSPIESYIVATENTRFGSDAEGVLFKKESLVNKTLFKYPTHRRSTTYTIPSTISYIGASAFENAKIIQIVTALGSILSIGDRAFANCECITSLFSMNYLSGVEEGSLGLQAFYGMKSILSLNFGSSAVTEIKDSTFEGCTALITLVLPSSVSILNNNIIKGTKVTSITIPNTVTKVFNTFLGADSLNNVNCRPTVPPTFSGTVSIFATGKELEASTFSLNVPRLNLATYQGQSGWSKYILKMKPTNF